MPEILTTAITTLLPLAIPLSIFNLGLEAGRPAIGRLLCHRAGLARFILVTFFIMPAVTLCLALTTSLQPPVVAGLFLMSICPGLGLSKKSVKLSGDSELGLAWEALAIPLSVVTIPLSLIAVETFLGIDFLPGGWEVLKKVVAIFLLPISLGRAVGEFWPKSAHALLTRLKPIATIGQIVLLLLVLLVGAPAILALGVRSILVVILIVAASIVLGHLLGGPSERTRPVLASTLALRWPAPALALAEINHMTADITAVIILFVLAGALLLIPYERWLKKRPISPGAASPTYSG